MPDALLASALRGRRILVVEDEYMMADDLQYDLEEVGAQVIGPVPSVADALALLAAEEAIDGAILDVNLRGEKAYPVADVLRERGVLFVLATGYEQGHCRRPARIYTLQHARRPASPRPCALE